MTLKNQPFRLRLKNALAGLNDAVRAEQSLRLQLLALAGLIALLAVLRPPALWTALLLLAAGGVLTAELLNSAIEALADHLHPQKHEAIGRVKDCAAAAVLVATLSALAVAGAFLRYWLTR